MISFSKLPRAGLANKLFVWAQGFVFSKRNNCPHTCVGWVKIHIGPLLRREQSLRFYAGYTPVASTIKSYLRLAKNGSKPKVFLAHQECDKIFLADATYVFSEVPHSADYFGSISFHRAAIIS